MSFVRTLSLAALFSAGAALALGQTGMVCSNATLHGRYAFTVTGQILTPVPAAGFVSGVTMTNFDGMGNMTQVDHVLHNGIPPIEEWRPGSGPYHVNPDCTGYMVIYAHPTNPADASPPLRVEFVVSDSGKQIRNVVSGSPANSAFTAAITSTATRVQ
ncbi:MAG TPA: hypothetical protein VMV57_08800 [Terracidiphilus sp.]|nr:hypothetical protein [Terracidiphilus sp.]